MRTVRQLLESKGPEVHAIGPDAAVIDAIRLMAEKGIGALVVLEPGGRLAGMVSERDYARKIVLDGRSSKETPVRDIMTSDIFSVGLDDVAPACMKLVTERRVRHLPVVDDGEVVGLVSIGDLVKAVIEEQQYELEQLQRYITT